MHIRLAQLPRPNQFVYSSKIRPDGQKTGWQYRPPTVTHMPFNILCFLKRHALVSRVYRRRRTWVSQQTSSRDNYDLLFTHFVLRVTLHAFTRRRATPRSRLHRCCICIPIPPALYRRPKQCYFYMPLQSAVHAYSGTRLHVGCIIVSVHLAQTITWASG